MKRQILMNLKKRKEKMYEFYYKAYGQMIKKRRLELKLTQEFVAKAICSNTYISKAENNQVLIGEEQLFQIMEKLNIRRTEFAKPETLVYYLEKIINLFYYEDLTEYKKLADKVEDYQFHVVTEIVKLGYLVLDKNYKKAKKISDQLLDYLNSMDELAFTLYLVFSSFLNVKLNNIKLAKYLIEAANVVDFEFMNLYNLILYTKFIVYGKSHLQMITQAKYNELIIKLGESYNYNRTKEVMVWKALFNEYNNISNDLYDIEDLIKDVDIDLVDEFLLIRAINTSSPKDYIDLFKSKENEYYMICLYLCAKEALNKQDNDLVKEYQKKISNLHYKVGSKVDYNNLLNLEKKNNFSFYKEYLINPCFKNAKEKENIFLMNRITNKIVETLKFRNRYKDALNYRERLLKDIKMIQT
ncbi:helix-turn-helix domain-containing protein [Mycoplasmatota bacterium]|nr:helix-turn-helix domain-containing protein [Mycoplasmatota bacterium]